MPKYMVEINGEIEDRLKVMRAGISAPDNRHVVCYALAVYEELVKNSVAGGSAFLRDSEGNEIELKIVP